MKKEEQNMSFLPQPFIDRMQQMLGDELACFLNSYEKPKFQSLRINVLKTTADSILKKKVLYATDNLESPLLSNPTLQVVPWCEDGYYYPSFLRPGKHIFHECGAYYIQEPSAMAPATFLDAKPGETILDLCAAPGGKSTQIASSMQGKGLLISNEIHPARAKILSENIERMGIRNAIVTNESPSTLANRFVSFFDKIMVDAPCSGEGMFRKNEEANEQWSLENVSLCAARQDEILEQADKMLKPGGRLVYSTCTFAPAENEGSIGRFLHSHPEYKLVTHPAQNGIQQGLVCDPNIASCPAFTDQDFATRVAQNVLRLWPHHLDGEGHFVAVLQKGSVPISAISTYVSAKQPEGFTLLAGKDKKTTSKLNQKKSGRNDFSKKDSLKKGNRLDSTDILSLVNDFFKTYIKSSFAGTLIPYGDQIYLLPEGAPSLSGLKVLRPGLHLGSIQKDKFEPSHALALSLQMEDVVFSHSFCSDVFAEYQTACHFVEGQTFPLEQEKGWYLICIDDLSIGWGRLAGGIMKNYYPKGLRKYLL